MAIASHLVKSHEIYVFLLVQIFLYLFVSIGPLMNSIVYESKLMKLGFFNFYLKPNYLVLHKTSRLTNHKNH
jgi:hypothetical protein